MKGDKQLLTTDYHEAKIKQVIFIVVITSNVGKEKLIIHVTGVEGTLLRIL